MFYIRIIGEKNWNILLYMNHSTTLPTYFADFIMTIVAQISDVVYGSLWHVSFIYFDTLKAGQYQHIIFLFIYFFIFYWTCTYSHTIV